MFRKFRKKIKRLKATKLQKEIYANNFGKEEDYTFVNLIKNKKHKSQKYFIDKNGEKNYNL